MEPACREGATERFKGKTHLVFGTAQLYIRPLAGRPLLTDGNQDPSEVLLALFSVRYLHTLGLMAQHPWWFHWDAATFVYNNLDKGSVCESVKSQGFQQEIL